MHNQTILDALFELTTHISSFEAHTYQRDVLKKIVSICGFSGGAILQIENYDRVFLSDYLAKEMPFTELELGDFLGNEWVAWHRDEGPYLNTFKGVSLVGVPFQSDVWGIFYSITSPSDAVIRALGLFAKSVAVWFQHARLLYETTPVPVPVNSDADQRLIALKKLYSIAEWDWNITTNECLISDAFISFFDHAKIKSNYMITDLYDFIGPKNTERFKACVAKVIDTRYQVLEEFKCPQLDGVTFHHIQILFDPIYDGTNLNRIMGFCRDKGRTHEADNHALHWFESDGLAQLPIVPLEWIVHANSSCEITMSIFHQDNLKEDVPRFTAELTKYLTQLFKESPYKGILNSAIQFPLFKYNYQLLAAQCPLDPLLWRGFLVIIKRATPQPANQLWLDTYQTSTAIRCTGVIEQLIDHGIPQYESLLTYLGQLMATSTHSLPWSDFLTQLTDAVADAPCPISIRPTIDETIQVPYAHWVISLVAHTLRPHYQADMAPVTIRLTHPSVIPSSNAQLIAANNAMQINVLIDHATLPNKFDLALLKLALAGSGLDMVVSHTKKGISYEFIMVVHTPDEPTLVRSQVLYEPTTLVTKKTALIIDDDDYNRQTLEVLFHTDGFRTITATQGKEALHLMDSLDIIDIIILDLRMPILDGFGVIHKLCEDPQFSHIPVVVVSANISPDTYTQLEKQGVDAVIEKPFDMDAFMQKVNELMEKRPKAIST
jgi:CheY-like chemotaxis protein